MFINILNYGWGYILRQINKDGKFKLIKYKSNIWRSIKLNYDTFK